MGDEWGTVRTTEGELVVGDDALRIRKTPRKFLRGQAARWRRRGYREKVSGALKVAGFLFVPLFLAGRFYDLSGRSLDAFVVYLLLLSVLGVGQFWARHVRGTRIPFSAVEDVALDTDDRELTITHDPTAVDEGDSRWYYLGEDPWRSVLAPERIETDLSLRTDDDVRDARTTLRSAGGVDAVVDDSGPETETERRFVTHSGAVFCPDCGTQVSPSDRTCPACGYGLRVERPVDADAVDEDDSRDRGREQDWEPAVEF